MISAIVLTRNENKNIRSCIKSLSWVDEVILIDDYSTDKTVKVAKKMGAKIYERHLNNNFADQRNFGLSKAKGDWILFLDADEIISNFLHKEILKEIEKTQNDGFYIKRRDWFLKKELKHGETGNIRLLRLARKGFGKWNRKVHEYWNIKGEIGELRNPILHNKNQNLFDFITKINMYSRIHAGELKGEGKKVDIFKITIWPAGKFFVNYFLKLGFLDGVEGLILAFMMSFHSFLAWSRLWLE